MQKEILSPTNFYQELLELPDTLYNGYYKRIDFTYSILHDIEEKIIVKPTCLDNTLNKTGVKPEDFNFIEYYNGFQDGLNSEYPKQLINTPEATLHTVLHRLMKRNYKFTVKYDKPTLYIEDHNIYKLGYQIGQCYKQWLDLFEDITLQSFLHEDIILEQKKIKRPDHIGYKTSLSKPQQVSLYNALIDKYIECTETDFLAMFSEKPKPIKWIKTKPLLGYFINNFPKLNTYNRWNIATNIFVSDTFNSINIQESLNKSSKFPKGWEELHQTIKPFL